MNKNYKTLIMLALVLSGCNKTVENIEVEPVVENVLSKAVVNGPVFIENSIEELQKSHIMLYKSEDILKRRKAITMSEEKQVEVPVNLAANKKNPTGKAVTKADASTGALDYDSDIVKLAQYYVDHYTGVCSEIEQKFMCEWLGLSSYDSRCEKPISEAEARPGDIVAYTGDHIAVYLGNGMALHGGMGGTGVKICTVHLGNTGTPYYYRYDVGNPAYKGSYSDLTGNPGWEYYVTDTSGEVVYYDSGYGQNPYMNRKSYDDYYLEYYQLFKSNPIPLDSSVCYVDNDSEFLACTIAYYDVYMTNGQIEPDAENAQVEEPVYEQPPVEEVRPEEPVTQEEIPEDQPVIQEPEVIEEPQPEQEVQSEENISEE